MPSVTFNASRRFRYLIPFNALWPLTNVSRSSRKKYRRRNNKVITSMMFLVVRYSVCVCKLIYNRQNNTDLVHDKKFHKQKYINLDKTFAFGSLQ